MKQYILRRAGYSLLSLFLLSLTIFFFVRVTGDPTTLMLEPGAARRTSTTCASSSGSISRCGCSTGTSSRAS